MRAGILGLPTYIQNEEEIERLASNANTSTTYVLLNFMPSTIVFFHLVYPGKTYISLYDDSSTDLHT